MREARIEVGVYPVIAPYGDEKTAGTRTKPAEKRLYFRERGGFLMKKTYALRKVEKILREVPAYRESLVYLTAVRSTGALSLREAETARKRIAYLTLTIASLERALGRLTPLERKVIDGLYAENEQTFEDVCERCALEKSSVYRYRAKALAKLAAAMFGE